MVIGKFVGVLPFSKFAGYMWMLSFSVNVSSFSNEKSLPVRAQCTSYISPMNDKKPRIICGCRSPRSGFSDRNCGVATMRLI